MDLRALFALLSSVSLLGSVSSARAEPLARRFELENGLRVVLDLDPTAAQVCVLVRYAVGSRDDPPGYRGLAHLTEHMTFRAGHTLRELEQLGATEYNGVTSPDDTFYYAKVPAAALESVLWLEAQRMAFAAAEMKAEDFALEQRVVLREWSERHDNPDHELEADLLEQVFPPDHVYARSGDKPSDVRAASLDDVRWFTQTHYRPDNAALVIVGKFDSAAAEAAIRRNFANVRSSSGERATRTAPQPARAARQARVRHEQNAVHGTVSLMWLVPGIRSPELPLLELTADLLSHELETQLVEGVGPASHAAAYLSVREAQSVFQIDLVARGDITPEDLSKRADAILAALSDAPIAPTTLQRAQNRLMRAALTEQSSLPQRALYAARGQVDPTSAYVAASTSDIQRILRHTLRSAPRGVGMRTQAKQ